MAKWILEEVQRMRVVAEVEAETEQEARNKYCDGIGVTVLSSKVLDSDGADCYPVSAPEEHHKP